MFLQIIFATYICASAAADLKDADNLGLYDPVKYNGGQYYHDDSGRYIPDYSGLYHPDGTGGYSGDDSGKFRQR